MRLKLPLLMASSLLWQAAAWGDEWVDYATAVTVTDGYLCAGEIYGDGTGTDIKCDMGNPFVDGDGNVGIGTATPANSLTVVGDLSATTLNAAQLCDEDGANCRDLSNAGSMVVSTTTMESGFPDYIRCLDSTTYQFRKLTFVNSTTVSYEYRTSSNRATFNLSDGGFVSEDGSATDCNGKSITQLYADGQAFNFLGNNGAQISLTQIADVSAAAPTDGQALVWDDSEGAWVASDASAGVSTLVSLTDVSPTAATEGQVLSYNDTTNSWEPSDTSVINNLDDIGDVSVSTPSDNNLLRYNTSTSKWEAVGINDGLSTTTMVPGWPDAIYCSDGSSYRMMYFDTDISGVYYYRFIQNPASSSDKVIWFNSSGDYTSLSGLSSSDCASQSISQLYAAGKAFNFLGNNGAQISLTQIADVSASAPTDGQVLAWDNANSKWVASDASAGANALVSLTDVSPTAATEGQVLSYNDTTNSWEPSDTSVINNLDDIGDVSVSTPADNNLLRYNTSTSKWEAVGINDGLSTTTMVPEWPDAIQCEKGADVRLLYYAHSHTSGSITKYRNLNNTTGDYYVQYNTSDGTYFGSTSGMVAFDCVTSSWSISELYSEGRAFNFLGNNGAQTNLTELIDVSASAPNDGDTLTWNSSSEKWESGSSDGGMPSGAVMAFNLASCPSGWSEYTPARGRFIRGIDSTGTNDPDGVRALGSTQDDGVESHQHDSPLVGNTGGHPSAPSQVFGSGATAASTGQNIEILIDSSSKATEGDEVSYRSSANISAISETRPINVALLYCEKD